MKNVLGMVLGLVVGVVVWALATSVLGLLAMWRPADGTDGLVQAVVGGISATPSWIIAAAVFFGISLLAMSFTGARYRYGSIGAVSGLLFLVAAWALWFFGVNLPSQAAVFGQFPSAEMWTEFKTLWFSGDESPELLGRYTLLPLAVLLGAGFGGQACGAVVRALGGGRKRIVRPVSFG
ncbi:MAG TPA: hypothetical protein VEA44_11345 [Caulobacter sp.]|nr:hypothetical protein [Caulobacter sp.]